MTEAAAPPPSGKSRRSFGCLQMGFVLVLVLIVTGGVLLWKFEGWIKEGAGWFQALSSHIISQNLTESFRQSVTEISSTNGDVLEVAVMRTDETVSRLDAKSVFNEMLPLGTTISEIRTPVVYRYHIRLSDPWRLEIQGNRCIVYAPALRPSQPPAIETQGMQKHSAAGWLRFNAAENLSQLEKDLTPTLEKRAATVANINLVREPARKSIGEFVQKWLLRQDPSTQSGIESVVVVFPGETSAAAPELPLQRP